VRPGSRMPVAGTLNRAPMSRFDELFMSVCRIYTHLGMGDLRQLGQARVVNRCAAARPRHLLTNRNLDPKEDPLKIYSLKRNAIPKLAVLATGLTAAILVATINPVPAQAFPNKQQDCTGCHGPGMVGGTTTATPSTLTPAAGAAYTVAITISANASAGDTGYWIANSTAAGATGTTTGVYGGYSGSGALSYAAPMTAPAASGTYYYKVWTVNGSTGSAATTTNFKVYSITVSAPVTTTEPPVTTTEPPVTTTEPPVTTSAVISSLSPRHGAIGDTVTITGTGFGALGSVQFGTVVTTASTWTDTQIVFDVPDGTSAKVAQVSVIPESDTASNAVNFRFDHVKAGGALHSLGENHSFMDRDSTADHSSRIDVDHCAFRGGYDD
jgi:IPT/TIG domain